MIDYDSLSIWLDARALGMFALVGMLIASFVALRIWNRRKQQKDAETLERAFTKPVPVPKPCCERRKAKEAKTTKVVPLVDQPGLHLGTHSV